MAYSSASLRYDSSAAGPNVVKSPSSYRWLWIAAIAAALVLRIFFVFTTDPEDGDSQMYEELAHNWRTSGIYGMDLGHDLPTPVDVLDRSTLGRTQVRVRATGDIGWTDVWLPDRPPGG